MAQPSSYDSPTVSVPSVEEESQDAGSEDPEEGQPVALNPPSGEPDPNIVVWEEGDTENPHTWSLARKWFVTVLLKILPLVVNVGSSILSASGASMVKEYHVSSEDTILVITLFLLGFTFGPLMFGPLSERIGRKIPIVIGVTLFATFCVPIALAQNFYTILICRFFSGLFGSAAMAVTGGAVTDIWPSPIIRGVGMDIFIMTGYLGPVLGPIIGNFITISHLGWRWVMWMTAIIAYSCIIIFFFTIPETFAPVLLNRKAHRLRLETKNWAIHSRLEESDTDLKSFAKAYLLRPWSKSPSDKRDSSGDGTYLFNRYHLYGTGSGALAGLCSFACNYGFCPMHVCTCTAQGGLVPAPSTTNTGGNPVQGKAADPENFEAASLWFTTWLDNFKGLMDKIVKYIETNVDYQLDAFVKVARTQLEILSEGATIEANKGICETNPSWGPSSHPLSRKRAIPPSCAPDYQGDPGEASNKAKIPDWVGCDTRLGFKYSSSDDILKAMKQGIKYVISDARGIPRPDQLPWQTTAKAAYPHIYRNSDNIAFSDEYRNSGNDYTGFIEFPIMPDGSILEAGRNSRIDVGVQRVVFKAKAHRNPLRDDWNYLFCGVMTHFTNVFETHIIDGESRRVLPFKLCEATCTSHLVGQCSWMWA